MLRRLISRVEGNWPSVFITYWAKKSDVGLAATFPRKLKNPLISSSFLITKLSSSNSSSSSSAPPPPLPPTPPPPLPLSLSCLFLSLLFYCPHNETFWSGSVEEWQELYYLCFNLSKIGIHVVHYTGHDVFACTCTHLCILNVCMHEYAHVCVYAYICIYICIGLCT